MDELIKYKDYFDNLFKGIDDNIYLDEEQRIAIINNNDYIMIIAGAGSGKTTTISAKIKYLVDIKKNNPEDIVILSFTNKAVDELKQRINVDFNINTNIYTFHKFSLVLLNNKNYKIISDNYFIIEKYFNDIFLNNKNNIKMLKKYFKKYVNIPFVYLNKKNIQIKDFINFCSEFISKMKIKNIDIDKISSKDNREMFFIRLIKDIYIYYEDYKTKNNLLDFNDMIIKAYDKVDNLNLNYKYIIVDEYQDISYQRFNLIKKIIDKTKSKLIVVGDDFQTIYSFSGSDINLFTDFKNIFNNSSICKITNTYRNSQELINIAGNFIMKDNNQIKKDLKSIKHNNNPIYIAYYSSFLKCSKIKKLNDCLKHINNNFKNSKVLILGRYKFDINYYLNDTLYKYNDKIISKKFNLDITYLTIHASKGLGFDNVIILNCNDDLYGFPSKIQDDPILNLLGKTDINEERRLFYVALTRTKNNIYILASKSRPSIYLKELNNITKL